MSERSQFSSTSQSQGSGVLTLADLDKLVESLRAESDAYQERASFLQSEQGIRLIHKAIKSGLIIESEGDDLPGTILRGVTISLPRKAVEE